MMTRYPAAPAIPLRVTITSVSSGRAAKPVERRVREPVRPEIIGYCQDWV